MSPDDLIELAAAVDHDEPDYSVLDEQIAMLDDPEAALKEVLRRVHVEFL